MPYRRPGRTLGTRRSRGPPVPPLSLLPQPRLPQVPGQGTGSMAGPNLSGITPRPLFSCHFHAAPTAFAARVGEPTHPLQHPVSSGIGDAAHHCRRPAPTRRAAWLPGRTPHLEPADGSPCPSALPGPRRRTLCRPLAVDPDSLSTLLPARQGARRTLPPHLSGSAQPRLSPEETALSRRVRPASATA